MWFFFFPGRIRLTRFALVSWARGCVWETGATNPLRVPLRPTASAGPTGAEPALDDAARLAHAVFDWALATQVARARHQSALERVSARVSGQFPRAELEPDATPLRPASYREQPLDEASLVLLATDLDSPAHLRTAAVATIRAQGSEEARACVEGALRILSLSPRRPVYPPW